MNNKSQLTNTKRPVPRKLNPGMITALSLAISQGNYPYTACKLCDIEYSTFAYWMKYAQEDIEKGEENIYTELYFAIKKAEAKREALLVQRLIDGAMPGERKRVIKRDADGKETLEITETGGDWIAAATFLERRHPDRWGRRDRHQVDISEKTQVQITRITVVMGQLGTRVPVVEGEAKELPEGDNE